jgi:restriction system protein
MRSVFRCFDFGHEHRFVSNTLLGKNAIWRLNVGGPTRFLATADTGGTGRKRRAKQGIVGLRGKSRGRAKVALAQASQQKELTALWRHNFPTDRIDVRWFQNRCEFCEAALVAISIPDRWPLDRCFLRQEHETRVDVMAHVEDTYAAYREIVSDFDIEDVQFRFCRMCGWWCIVQDVHYQVPGRTFIAFNWAAGCLRDHLTSKIGLPLYELRQILCANYEQRFLLAPRQLEDIVASVFKSLGCAVQVSKQSHDGGIDVFGLDEQGVPFGIQVKRYRNKVRIEEIRSFLGALLLHGNAHGVFVTTSTFSNGVCRLKRQAGMVGIQLDCVDAERLLEMIKVAQIRDFDPNQALDLAEKYASQIPLLNFGYCSHLGSL